MVMSNGVPTQPMVMSNGVRHLIYIETPQDVRDDIAGASAVTWEVVRGDTEDSSGGDIAGCLVWHSMERVVDNCADEPRPRRKNADIWPPRSAGQVFRPYCREGVKTVRILISPFTEIGAIQFCGTPLLDFPNLMINYL